MGSRKVKTMEIKVSLPNPIELGPEMFIAQLRIALKAFEKSYEEATKNLTKEEKEEFWVRFRLPKLDEEIDGIDSDHEKDQEIELRLLSN